MKNKINILISAVLILLILPVQFACNKDKLLQQEIEEQAITNEQMPDDLTPPPLPTTDPDGNPFDPDAPVIYDDISSALKGSVPGEVLDIYIKDSNGGTVDSWDTEMKHFIKVSNGGRTCHDHYYSYQYYKRNNGNWTYKGTYNNYNGIVGASTTSLCSWDVSFREDDVIQTYTWVYDYPSSTWHGAWGPTYTIENPESPSPYFEFVLDEMINYVVGGIFNGFGIPFTQIASWVSGGLYNECVTITVIDQDGNPLHATVKWDPFHIDGTFLGSVEHDNAENSFAYATVTCYEPNGPESYDNNLYGREVTVNAGLPYVYNEDNYWGPGEDGHMPVITVTFNTDGTTTVDYPEKGFTDPRDGQVYQTVTIGTQTWMAENLNYNCSGSYWYNNSSANGDIYGRLYNWDAAANAAPPGWHLPTNAEWTELRDYLGGSSVAGGKMKEIGTAHWNSPNAGATNISGFTALAGGMKHYNGNFFHNGEYGYFYSSTVHPNTGVYACRLYRNSSTMNQYTYNRGCSLSVRCIKDN